jgi:hypothetical protein
VAFGERVEIERDVLFGARKIALPRVNRVLLALFRARIVKICTEPIRHAEVRLFHVGEHLVVECVLQLLRRREHGFRVRVLGFEVVGDAGHMFFP